MNKPMIDKTMEETLTVAPEIRQLNKFAKQAGRVAISSINPMYGHNDRGHKILGFTIRVEGPAKHLSYFHRLVDEAKLKIS